MDAKHKEITKQLLADWEKKNPVKHQTSEQRIAKLRKNLAHYTSNQKTIDLFCAWAVSRGIIYDAGVLLTDFPDVVTKYVLDFADWLSLQK